MPNDRETREPVRVLLVHAHPEPSSFSHAIRDRALAGLERGRHQVDVIDLYAERFDAVMSRQERLAYETDHPILDPTVSRHAQLVGDADALVFVYPTWWWGLPAILKGWLERVLVKGVAFDLHPTTNRFRPRLRARRIVGISTYGSSPRYVRFFTDAGRRTLTRGLWLSCRSRRCRRRWLGLYSADTASDEQRDQFLAKVERIMAAL